ncbi:MAG TPA: DUF58 domain-containing protein [Planctomycetota bacterium]|nr:DUF58 domain-containing protein [Planctomycetota bacterium]
MAGSLDPAVLDKLAGLSLVARTVVDGYLAGQHRSPKRGSSAEFAQHREYVSGDELRRIDWKVFARSDRLVIKEYDDETSLDCHLLVDGSESMAFGSLPWTKFEYARWCAAALAQLVLQARDTAGLVLFDETERKKVPPKTGTAQKHDILAALEEYQPGGKTKIGDVLFWLTSRLRRKGIVAIFSDFFDEPDKIVEGLRRLSYAGHEPILFQIVDPLEQTFDISYLVRLDGLEGAGVHKVDPKSLRAAYIEEFEAHQRDLAAQTRHLGLDYVKLSTGQDLGAALSTYLARRAARSRGGRR